MLIETQFTHLLRSLTDWSRAQTAFSLLGKGDFEGTPPTAQALGSEGFRAPSRRLAAGTPSVLTAREIHRGIDYRETSFNPWAFS